MDFRHDAYLLPTPRHASPPLYEEQTQQLEQAGAQAGAGQAQTAKMHGENK